MSDNFRAKPSDLAKVWGMIKSSEQRQMTIRIPADTSYKIQAIELMFPHRSRNELIADLLATALDEFEDGLPFLNRETSHVIGFDENEEPIYESFQIGPKVDFRDFLEQVRSNANSGSGLSVDGKEVSEND